MFIAPFTMQEACILALKFKHLEKQVFEGINGDVYTVMTTTFVPYGEQHTIKVAELLFQALNNSDKYSVKDILNYINSYRGPDFDVIALATSSKGGKIDVEARQMQLVSIDNKLEYHFVLPLINS